MLLIGVCGRNGSGKSTFCKAMAEELGAKTWSLSAAIRASLAEKGIEPSRDALIAHGNEMRAAGGAGVLARGTLKLIFESGVTVALVDSLRHPDEVAELARVPGFVLIAVDAPAALRMDRMALRGRSGDSVSLETFSAAERREERGEGNVLGQLLGPVMTLADVVVDNGSNGTTPRALVARVKDRVLGLANARSALLGEAAGMVRNGDEVDKALCVVVMNGDEEVKRDWSALAKVSSGTKTMPKLKVVDGSIESEYVQAVDNGGADVIVVPDIETEGATKTMVTRWAALMALRRPRLVLLGPTLLSSGSVLGSVPGLLKRGMILSLPEGVEEPSLSSMVCCDGVSVESSGSRVAWSDGIVSWAHASSHKDAFVEVAVLQLCGSDAVVGK